MKHSIINEHGGQFIGAFWFKLTKSGNLVGEYTISESKDKHILCEAAFRIEPASETAAYTFDGTYKATWYNTPKDSTPDHSTLTINMICGSEGRYDLEWKNNNTIRFTGVGLLAGNRLVGGYIKHE